MTPLPNLKPRDVDMSPEAIDRRLRECSELSYLCRMLASAKRLGTVKEIREQERQAALDAAKTGPHQAESTEESTETEQKDHL